MDIKTKKINDIVVKKVLTKKKLNSNQILGYDMFPELYSNTYICSKKRMGKTNVIYNILDKCADKDTSVMFFVSTIDKDDTYKAILKMLDKKGINYQCHTSIVENGVNLLNEFINVLNDEASYLEEEPKKIVVNPIVKFDNEIDKKEAIEIKKKKKKLNSPEHIIVIDDLGKECRDPGVESLMKKFRHYKAKIIISSQYLSDLTPASIKQLDYSLIFRSFDKEKLEKLHDSLDLCIPIEEFEKIYNYATKEPYNFLYCSNDGHFRKNFNEEILVK